MLVTEKQCQVNISTEQVKSFIICPSYYNCADEAMAKTRPVEQVIYVGLASSERCGLLIVHVNYSTERTPSRITQRYIELRQVTTGVALPWRRLL